MHQMKIAVFSPFVNDTTAAYAEGVIERLMSMKVTVAVDEKLLAILKNKKIEEQLVPMGSLDQTTQYLICIGGDGSMLQAVQKVKDSEVPILGINTGRLGFLTSLQKESLDKGLNLLFEKQYSLVRRTVLEVQLEAPYQSLIEFPYALNEISVSRKDTASLISVAAQINQKQLTTYWADGLIVATPTGSTGYNLSSGGPIVLPETPSLVLTPIAPHNLNIRPLVVPNDAQILLDVGGREKEHLLSLDSRIVSLPHNTPITIQKAKFKIVTVQFSDTAFYTALGEKLFWGLDKRN